MQLTRIKSHQNTSRTIEDTVITQVAQISPKIFHAPNNQSDNEFYSGIRKNTLADDSCLNTTYNIHSQEHNSRTIANSEEGRYREMECLTTETEMISANFSETRNNRSAKQQVSIALESLDNA